MQQVTLTERQFENICTGGLITSKAKKHSYITVPQSLIDQLTWTSEEKKTIKAWNKFKSKTI